MAERTPQLEQLEHFDIAWGKPAGKSVQLVEGVPTDPHKANASIALSYASHASYGRRLSQIDILRDAGTTIAQFRRSVVYSADNLTESLSAWTLV